MKAFFNIFLGLIACGIFTQHAHAGCAKCDAIEKKRAEEQAQKGPQQDQYYEDQFKDKITKVNTQNLDNQPNNTDIPNATITDEDAK